MVNNLTIKNNFDLITVFCDGKKETLSKFGNDYKILSAIKTAFLLNFQVNPKFMKTYYLANFFADKDMSAQLRFYNYSGQCYFSFYHTEYFKANQDLKAYEEINTDLSFPVSTCEEGIENLPNYCHRILKSTCEKQKKVLNYQKEEYLKKYRKQDAELSKKLSLLEREI